MPRISSCPWRYVLLTGLILTPPGHAVARQPGARVIYVDASASSGGYGTSWDDAFRQLQFALAEAGEPDRGPVEIWVAEGTYVPFPEVDGERGTRAATFSLVDGVEVLGGFEGTEHRREERDAERHVTILSGDLSLATTSDCCAVHGTPGCDEANCQSLVCSILPMCCDEPWDEVCVALARLHCGLCDRPYGYSYHVVSAIGLEGGAVLDGFTILEGLATGGCCTADRGGGLYMNRAEATFRRCRFIENGATNVAAAVWMRESTGRFEQCTFERNVVWPGDSGAAIQDVFGSRLVLVDCLFLDNTLGRSTTGGGAIFVGGNILNAEASCVDAVNCVFIGNSGSAGGAILNNGFARLHNCVLAGNEALGDGHGTFTGKGGAIANFGQLFATGCTVHANHAAVIGDGIYTGDDTNNTRLLSDLAVAGCILWGNGGPAGTEDCQIVSNETPLVIDYSCIQGLTGGLGGRGNIDLSPAFVDPIGEDRIVGTWDDDLRLTSGSPCIDAGWNNAVPADTWDVDGDGRRDEFLPIDVRGSPRFVNALDVPDGGCGVRARVDMGAYEFAAGVDDPPRRGDIDGDGLIGVEDLMLVVTGWGSDRCGVDLNADQVVDFQDIQIIVSGWDDGQAGP